MIEYSELISYQSMNYNAVEKLNIIFIDRVLNIFELKEPQSFNYLKNFLLVI
jgi:hypothetical protein